MNFIRSNVLVLNRSSLRDIANVIDEEISRLPSCFKYLQWYFAVNNAIKTKSYHSVILKSRKKAPENICYIKFCNKAVKLINLPSPEAKVRRGEAVASPKLKDLKELPQHKKIVQP